MQCPECRHENPAEARFCMECGASLAASNAATPSRLEQMHSQSDSFIPGPLAKRMQVAERELEGENRLVTAMFVDITGLTPLSESLPTEVVVEKVNECFKAIADSVYRYEGSVNRFIGDCALVFFGAPLSHENDAERAVRAALDILRAVIEVELDVTIGINTGMMYFGPIGSVQHQEVSAYGHDINLAKRLQDLAKPATILVGVGTHRLTSTMFEFEPLEPQKLKGVKEPVTIFRVLGVSERPEKLRGIEGLGVAMVGRDREFADIKKVARRIQAGEGQVVSVIGEAGIGKSRLVTELKRHLLGGGGTDDSRPGARSIQVLEGRCVSIGESASYWPFLDILRSDFGLNQKDSNEELARKTTEAVSALMPETADEILPLLGRILSIRFDNELDRKLDYVAAEQVRLRTLSQLQSLCHALAKREPLLLVLEDLHWADHLSLDLVLLLMELVATTPMLLLLVYRPDEDQRSSQLGATAQDKCGERYTEIRLSHLSGSQSRQLLDALISIDDFPEAVRQSILDKSEGNPFYIEEVVRSLIDHGHLYRQGDTWKAGDDLSKIEVPETIHSVVAARVDRLDTKAKAVLQCASVIGRLFNHGLLEHLTQTPGLSSHLNELEDKQLVYRERQVPELEYSFKHAFTQEATYQGILNKRKRELHLQVGEGMEHLYRDRLEENYEKLAYHYALSDRDDKAIEYLFKAGEKAKHRSAYRAAVYHLQQALERLEQTPPSSDLAQAELNIQINLGFSLMAITGYGAPEVEKAYTRARELSEQFGNSAQRLIVLFALFGWSLVRGQQKRTLEFGREHFRLAQKEEDVVFLVESHQANAGPLYFMGEFAEARQQCEDGINLYQLEPQRARLMHLVQDPGEFLLDYLAMSLWNLGYPDQALERSRNALELASKVEHAFTRTHGLWMSIFVHRLRGEETMARQRIDAVIELAVAEGFGLFVGAASMWQGWASARDGQVDEGVAAIQQGLAGTRMAGMEIWRSFFLSLVAEIYLNAGRTEEGIQTVDEALAAVEANEERCVEAELYRLKGELLARLGSQDEAESNIRRAIDIARSQQAKSLELRATMSWARLRRSRGDSTEARQALSDIYGWFTEGFDTTDLGDAKALLEAQS
ncbi:MAG: adenylate/guanylate cyclase domain-containing protein [Acidobacteria bacterium]|nr:MAG: adenylate/guanylate cyclase domain-containing protein [Acidobacteriota bacterium]